jgi:hypothetical protein
MSSNDSKSSSSDASSSASSKAKVMPCDIEYDAFVKCVESHPRGLTQASECGHEKDIYKACMASLRKKK